MLTVVLIALLAPAQPNVAQSEWEIEAAAAAKDDAGSEARLQAKRAREERTGRLFWTTTAAAAGPALLSTALLTAAGTAGAITEIPAAPVLFLAAPLVTMTVCAAAIAAVLLAFDQTIQQTSLVTGASILAIGLSTLAGGAVGIAGGVAIGQVFPLRDVAALALGISGGMIAGGTLAAATVPAFLATSYFDE